MCGDPGAQAHLPIRVPCRIHRQGPAHPCLPAPAAGLAPCCPWPCRQAGPARGHQAGPKKALLRPGLPTAGLNPTPDLSPRDSYSQKVRVITAQSPRPFYGKAFGCLSSPAASHTVGAQHWLEEKAGGRSSPLATTDQPPGMSAMHPASPCDPSLSPSTNPVGQPMQRWEGKTHGG